eukprot:4904118-Prymnesium_polylepis.1
MNLVHAVPRPFKRKPNGTQNAVDVQRVVALAPLPLRAYIVWRHGEPRARALDTRAAGLE